MDANAKPGSLLEPDVVSIAQLPHEIALHRENNHKETAKVAIAF